MITLFEHLLSLGLTKPQARAALATGKVSLNDIPTSDGGRLLEPEQAASRVKVNNNAPRITPGRDVSLVFRDEHLVVAWKPPGMISVPAAGRDKFSDLVSQVARILGKAMPVHRLDEQTSGLIVLARTESTRAALKDLFFKHEVERRYLAIVQGGVPARPTVVTTQMVRNRGDGLRGSLEVPERKGWRRPPNQVVKEATTHLRRVAVLQQGFSMVEARLETGRTHQVRIHLAEKGYPVLGDPLYAPRSVQQAGPRLALHAAVLGFKHPVTRQEMRWVAPLADDLERLRRALDKPPEPKEARKLSKRKGRKGKRKR